jgi:hypothetical protein
MTGPHGAVADVGEAILRIDVFFEHLAWPERDDSTGRNPNFFSGPRIPALTRAFASHDKIAKTRDLDRFAFLKDRLQEIEHQFDDICRFIFRNADLLENFIGDISLSHAIPLRDHSRSPRCALGHPSWCAASFA